MTALDTACPVCRSEGWDMSARVPDIRFGSADVPFEVWRCRACGVEQTGQDGRPVDPSGHYPAEYGAFRADSSPPRRDRTVAWMALGRTAWTNRVLPARRLLDVGSGSGRLLGALAGSVDEAVGVEPDERAAAAARRAGLDVRTGTIETLEDDAAFDVVVFSHVLEHTTNPAEVLRHAWRLLVAGGRVVVALPNAASVERRIFGPAWDGWDIPRHVFHFDRASLGHAVTAAGFTVESTSYEVYSLLRRSLANGGTSAAVTRFLAPAERALGLLQALTRTSGAIQMIARKV